MPTPTATCTFSRQAPAWRLMALGRDDRPVESERETKSISAEQTFSRDVKDLEQLVAVLREQAAEVAQRLAHEQLEAVTVHLKLRYADFTTITRSRTVSRGLRLPGEITDIGLHLLHQQAPLPPIRLIGLGVSGLLTLHRPRQLEFEFTQA